MRLFLTAVLSAAAFAAAAGVAAGTTVKATLTVSQGSLHGAHFGRREVVRIVFLGPAPLAQRRVRTTATGSFVTPMPSYDPCVESLQVRAVGARGDQARLKLPQRACPMPLRPGG